MQSATEGWVRFLVPAAVPAAILKVGDIQRATATIPIDLRSVTTNDSDVGVSSWRHPVDIAVTFERRVGPVVYNINGMRLDHFSDSIAHVQPDKLELSVNVRMKNVGGRYGHVASNEEFRLLVDDVPLAPTSALAQLLTYEDHLDAEVVFVMPATAKTVVLQLGNIAANTVRVPLDLSPARSPAPR